MKLHTVTTVLVVLSCIASVGVASTTLETSLSTNPDEVVNLDYDTVPISPDTAGDIKRAVTGESAASPPADAADGQSGGAAEQNQQSKSQASGDKAQNQRQSREQRAGQVAEPAKGLLDLLMNFLETWLPLFVGLAALLVVTVALARYGDGLIRQREGDGGHAAGPMKPEPQNAVEHAWVALLAAADVDDPWRRTPEECASVAVERGFDPEGVERLRRVFEEVRYGGREVTDARVKRMEQGLTRLDGVREEGVRR